MPIFMQMGLPGEENRLKGEVKEPPHVDWFEVSSAQFGISQYAHYSPGASAAQREGRRPEIRQIIVTLDEANPLLMKASIDGKLFETVVIDFEHDGRPDLVVKLTDVVVSGYSLSGRGGDGDQPTASVTLTFTEVEQHYSPASAQLDSDATANPVGDVLPIMVLRQLVNAFLGAEP